MGKYRDLKSKLQLLQQEYQILIEKLAKVQLAFGEAATRQQMIEKGLDGHIVKDVTPLILGYVGVATDTNQEITALNQQKQTLDNKTSNIQRELSDISWYKSRC